jgi:hypothetical protein
MLNAGLNLLLSIILAPRLGVFGVMLGTLIAHALTSTWFVPLLACKKIELSIREFVLRGILPPLLTGIPAAAVTWIFVRTLFAGTTFFQLGVQGLLVVTIYVPLFIAFGSNKDDRQLLASLLPKALWRQKRAAFTEMHDPSENIGRGVSVFQTDAERPRFLPPGE